MQQNEKGSKSYLFGIVLVAVLGGLLFGYDTAVISGAEKGLQAFFKGADGFVYTDFMHGFTMPPTDSPARAPSSAASSARRSRACLPHASAASVRCSSQASASSSPLGEA